MDSLSLPPTDADRDPASFWDSVVSHALRWGEAQHVDWRDAIVLLPFAQLLAPARQAWARAGGWMPRIETTQTLAGSLAPPPAPQPGQITFDTPTDRLIAARMLREQAWARAWSARDIRHFEHCVASMVELAHALARRAASLAPPAREGWWRDGRAHLSAVDGPGRYERELARAALDWAAAAAPAATDALYGLRPSAWLAVQAGGADALTRALLAHAGGPQLLVDTDAPARSPFDAVVATSVEMLLADDFESEAQQCAARVLRHLSQAQQPVALIAQDRTLVRRVRALLERRGVGLLDETGWRLSTTRSAARVMALLRAMRAHPSSDDLLDWLKASSGDGPALRQRAEGTLSLETAMRRHGWSRWASVDPSRLDRAGARVHADVQAMRERFAAPGVRVLSAWLSALDDALVASGDGPVLAADAAGQQVLATLKLQGAADDGPAWADVADRVPMHLDEFIRWADGALEDATFRPPAHDAAQVVITPLGRAMLRPFAAVVFPGADERRLGRGGRAWPLVSDALAARLGLDDAAVRRERETLAFAQLLRVRRACLLRRRRDGSEPVAASPLVERLRLALLRRGSDLSPAADPRERVVVDARPTRRPGPAAPALLPARLSASAIQRLRTCPYQFFAFSLLGLQEHEELEETVEKRDYGTWLHAVLHRFHLERARGDAVGDDRARLIAAAERQREAQGLDEAEFLPFRASFEQFVPRYLEWLGEREAAGAAWMEGEKEVHAFPQELRGIELHGRIDRIDRVREGGDSALELIDYKTGSASALKEQLKQATEDTQLAFYAALMMCDEHASQEPLRASYLPLDDRKPIEALTHPNVERTAAMLLEELGREIERLRAGAPMAPLGSGKACDFCAARGLCRRDDWSADT